MKDFKRHTLSLNWLMLSIGLLLLECLFRILAQSDFTGFRIIRIVFFSLAFAGLLNFITYPMSRKWSNIFSTTTLALFAFFGLTQLTYRNYLNAYYSFRLFLNMADRVEGYAGDFVAYIKPEFLILFIPAILYAFVYRRLTKTTSKTFIMKKWIGVWVLTLILHLAGILSLGWFVDPESMVVPKDLYAFPYLTEMSLDQFGIVRTVQRDTLTLFKEEPENGFELVEVEETLPQKPQNQTPDLTRLIDDSAWKALAEAETNETMKKIDAYLMDRPISLKNEMTGLFKDKNLIFIMVEAFDLMAIHPTLTPTLYKMTQQGFYFDHYYSPQFSCATGESEFISLTSLIPRSGICSPNTYTDNTFSNSLFSLFNEAGYASTSYHNYSDKFYQRSELHVNMGSIKFYNNDDLTIKTLKGWPSDINLVEEALPHFIDEEKFFSFIITSSMHMPYDIDSTLGNRYLDEVAAVYPDAPINIQRYKSKAMEFDKSIETLIENLKTAGKLEDTVIVLFADHFPLKTSRSDILDNTDQDVNRDYGYNIMLSPMIIYNSTTRPKLVSTVSSTFDLLPTIANLFDLDYDPRYYFGSDIFDRDAQHLVPFVSLNWVNENGYYAPSKSKFFPDSNSEALSDEEVKAINIRLKNDAEISYQILKSDYFAMR